MGSLLMSGSLAVNVTPYGEIFIWWLIEIEFEIWRNEFFTETLWDWLQLFLEIIKLSSVHISEMYCSSHFFQVVVVGGRGKFLYGRYRRASGMAPFFRPGNISMGILFHPQIYESPKCSDSDVWMTNFVLLELEKPLKLYTVSKLVYACSGQFFLNRLHVAVLLKNGVYYVY